MDEIDDVWEVDLFGNGSYWVAEETYNKIKAAMMDINIDKTNAAITFKSVNGSEVVILLTNICNLQYSNKKVRDRVRAVNKEHAKEGEKKEWEE